MALVGPGLTEEVDESVLTTDALWEAVTGKPGQGWVETVKVIDRSEAAKKQPATPAQLQYLSSLITKVSDEEFDAAFTKATKRAGISLRRPDERTDRAIRRLTKATARALITVLAGHR